ncbi:MAG: MATE family efflux transporter [Lachnospiraceae bacterium]|nr:MATE family efflux transporter [Lachnospiraceae bacterium]
MEQTYMKEKPVLQLVISMSLPMIISMAVSSLYNIIDSLFVARINEQAMTALSLVFPVQNLVNAVTIGFGIGINAVIAFYLGAGDNQKADKAASLGLLLSILHGVLLTIGCIIVMPAFLKAFTSDMEIITLGLKYSNIVFCFSTVIALGLFFEKVFQAVGKMTVSMISMMIGCIANIILDPILIFGLGPAPELGIKGAAVATGAGQILTLVSYLLFYFLSPIPVKLRKKNFRWDPKLAVKLYSIGIPATLNLALPSVLISALNGILAAFSQSYVLVLGIYYKLQTFLYLSANGIIQGIRPLIGYNYGAGEHGRVRRIYSTTLLLTICIMIAGTGLCLFFPSRLMLLFTDNSSTIVIGASALRIICAGFIVSSLSVVSSGALEGLGMGMPSLLISLCRYLIVIIPAAFVLSRLFGAAGVWHAFWITELISAVFSFLLYRKKTP